MKRPHLIAVLILLLSAAAGLADEVPLVGRTVTLSPCPDSPNCVSSLASDARHAIAPLSVKGDPDRAMADLAAVVRAMARSTIVSEGPDQLTAEFRTFLGFVDDAEFLLDRARNVIHVRSASRLGYWDIGVNRKRIEEIRGRL